MGRASPFFNNFWFQSSQIDTSFIVNYHADGEETIRPLRFWLNSLENG